jgi:hypothetical protein
MTTRFVSAAEVMSRALGMPDYRFALIEHPISSTTDEGLLLRAAATIVQVREILSLG